MKRQLLIPVNERGEDIDGSTKLAKKTKKKVQKVQKPEPEASSASRFDFNLPWAPVNMTNNMMLAQTEKLTGLMSVDVIDGSYYGKIYSGGVLYGETGKVVHHQKDAVPEKKSKQTKKSTTSEPLKNGGLDKKTIQALEAHKKETEELPQFDFSFDDEEDMENMFGDEDVEDFDEDDLVGIPMEEDDYNEIIEDDENDVFNFGEGSMSYDEDTIDEDSFEDFEETSGFLVGSSDDEQEAQSEEETSARMVLPSKDVVKQLQKTKAPQKQTVVLAKEESEEEAEDMEDMEDMMFEEDDDEDLEFDDELPQDQANFDHLKSLISTEESIEQPSAVSTAVVEATPVETPFDIDGDFFLDNPQYIAWQSYNLHPLLLRGIRDLRFISPTPIQREVLTPAIRYYKDVVGASQTGSGKTLSFALPIINRIIADRFKRGEGHKYTDEDSTFLTGDGVSHRGQKGKNRPQAHNSAAKEHQRLIKFDDQLTGLILTPTRELAVQIVTHINAVAVHAHVRAVAIVGGLSHEKQERLLSYNPTIVVATPGRLWELIVKSTPVFANMENLRFFVLDEADRMVANGHFPELDQIISYVQSFRDQAASGDAAPLKPIPSNDDSDDELEDNDDFIILDSDTPQVKKKQQKMQIFLFSATLTLQDEGRTTRKNKFVKFDPNNVGKPGRKMLAELAHRLPFDTKPHVVDFSSHMLVASNLRQCYMECTDEDRDVYLYSQLHALEGRAIVFANAISIVKKITEVLRELQFEAFPLHAQMQQNQRLAIMDKFRKRQKAIIVCTDVAARGLDVPAVELVIQYHVPYTPETYIHRAGRTARAGTVGRNILLVGSGEQTDYKRLMHVLGASGLEMELIRPNTRYIMELRRRLRLAEQITKLLQTKMSDKLDSAWLAANADAAGLLVDDDEDLDKDAGVTLRGPRGKNGGKGKTELLLKKLNEDDDAFHSRVFKHKKSRNEVLSKRAELAHLLKQTIYVKASM